MVSIVVDGNIFIKHSVWSSTMPSIGARRAAPCVSAAVTPASVGSHHAGDIEAQSCDTFYHIVLRRSVVGGQACGFHGAGITCHRLRWILLAGQ